MQDFCGLFGSESVSPGHPDKVADQLADVILDGLLSQDEKARVACECLVKTGMVLLAGEVSTTSWVDMEALIRQKLRQIGYTDSKWGFDADACSVVNTIGQQSADIAGGVDRDNQENQGAGDQGLMYGFACQQTSQAMPAPIMLANQLMKAQKDLRSTYSWLGPDAKAQVIMHYEDGEPKAIAKIILSTQHDAHISETKLKQVVQSDLIHANIPNHLLTNATEYFINPTGKFIIGGPQADCGLTGRKIIVDTYGGAARHGGGAFSGKDPSKVDRSAAYMARYIAKQVVCAGLAKQCEIQITYAIGLAEPTSMYVHTFGTGVITDQALTAAITEHFSLTPYAITKKLNLNQPIYEPTAALGHFGRSDFAWEQLHDVQALQSWVNTTQLLDFEPQINF